MKRLFVLVTLVSWCEAEAQFCPGNPVLPLPKRDDQCEPSMYASDPVQLGGKMTVHAVTDVSIPIAKGQLEFTRYYVPTESTWSYPDGAFDDQSVPRPFGKAVAQNSMYWWHNHYFFVVAQMGQEPNGDWSPDYGSKKLYDMTGRQTRYYPCSAGMSCWLPPDYPYAGTKWRVAWNGTPTVYAPDGTRYNLSSMYSSLYQTPSEDQPPAVTYFPTSVVDRNGAVILTYAYADPVAGQACPKGAFSTPEPNVPYLSTVTASDGKRLRFSYQLLGAECVLSSVTLEVPGGSSEVIASFTYAGGVPGKLQSSLTETYEYSPNFRVLDASGVEKVRHEPVVSAPLVVSKAVTVHASMQRTPREA